MQRYFLDCDNGIIDNQDAHHIITVMRGKNDDKIIVCHQGLCHLAAITIENKTVHYKKIAAENAKKQLKVDIYQGLPKGNKVDLICRSATIFGGDALYFVPMKRSIAKLSNETHKIKRYQQIIKEAAELSHRTTLMEVSFLDSLKQINYAKYDLVILADEDQKDLKLTEVIKNNRELKIAAIIGPEGGIDATEREYLLALNAKIITLGSYIIPTELAHIPILNLIYDKID